ncbi:DUF4232 domain-containing protein [Streptomyces sp. HNM0575]|uniref:DUF4232 domain-containing protein n=1 Tax=Streptomyces sp. HNM0575 TaxID=2716338 RepID=UPI00145E036D|nr:DUF4232 domain-containing protein [Streptomyces sp. HNM0575]NLU73508.1 DUF4232 domain-containing protein [Streptomyces sp. HNM0575]
MGAHHARSVLAALALGATVTVSGCTAGSGSSANSPASVHDAGSGTPSSPGSQEADPGGSQPPRAQSGQDGSGRPGGSGSGDDRPRWCTTDALSVSLKPGQPAAGNRYAGLVLTNSSSHTCRTQGWPGLQLTGENGEKIPTKVVREHSTPSPQLTLSPGGQASARLHWTVVPGQGDPDDGRCPAPESVRVIPPDQRASKSAPWNMNEVCGAGKLDVRPLLPG